RCIGQDLDRRGIKSFDIRFEANEYVVHGGYQEPPAATPVTIQYRPLDIADLDDAGAARQGKAMPAKEFLNQEQILRTIGGFLEKNEARLIRMTNNEPAAGEPSVKVEYISRDGERVCADRTGTALYDMCVAMYKHRRRLTGTGGRFSRWRR
ncbi:MAG: hypothetical protein ACREOR_07545, partial [Candidatus Binatia bacterium]